LFFGGCDGRHGGRSFFAALRGGILVRGHSAWSPVARLRRRRK
jgi:hypothetical protein